MANSKDLTVPAPYSWSPSIYWDGNDGSWNSFIVQVGTPPQPFRVLPSTAGQETWVLNPEGCSTSDPSDCPYLRGALPFDGTNGTGFQVNESSTWDAQGIYTLNTQEEVMGYYGNGLYGFDTVVLGNGSDVSNLTQQVVAGIADKSYFLGQFGIGPKSINFTTFNDPIPNYLSNLVNDSKISSLSFGYTAGAAYRNNAPASLTLGGYDTSRFTPSTLSFAMNADNSRPLQVGVTKIMGVNTLSGSVNLLPTSTYHFIDSTIPHIWLPDDATDAFVAAFGLTYDNNTDLFLINDTMRAQHLQNNPTVTFVLSKNDQDGTASTQNIELPYAAFDLQASWPFYNSSTYYFPIRRAQNDTQYTIGRTFFQEAYVIADWERQNFTVAQTTFTSLDNPSLVPILSVAEEAARNQTSSTHSPQKQGIGTGAIAGIAVGGAAVAALLVVGIFLMWRRRKQHKHLPVPTADDDLPYPEDKKAEYEQPASELPYDHAINELASPPTEAEMDGKTAKWGVLSAQEMPSPPVGHESGLQELGHGDGFIAEAPGSEGVRYELPGHEIKPK